MEIFLVRHGEAAASWGEESDPGLSDLGRAQAAESARSLQRLVPPNTELVSSPLLRAQETAAPLAENLGRKRVELDSVYREIPSPVPMSERQGWLRQFMQQQWSEQPDSLLEWREAILQNLLAARQSQVVFTHFLVINAVVGKIQQRSETLCCWPDNGSITHLRHNGSRLELVTLGKEIETVIN